MKTLKIDVHTHILPKNWPNLKEKYGYGGFISLEHHEPGKARMLVDGKLFRVIEDNCWNPDTRIKESDRDEVRIQVLSTVPVMFRYVFVYPKFWMVHSLHFIHSDLLCHLFRY